MSSPQEHAKPAIASALGWGALALFLVIPLADILVGVVALLTGLSTGSESEQSLATLLPGMVVRGGLLLSLVLLMWHQRKLTGLLVLGMVLLLFALTEAMSLLQHQNLGNFVYGVSYAFKISLILLVFFHVVTAPSEDPVLRYSALIIRWSFCAYSFAVVIGHLTAFEYTTYGGLGSSGLMIKGSGNSISLIMLLGSAFVVDALARSRGALRAWWCVVYICGLYAAGLLLTKGALLGIILPSAAYGMRMILNGRSVLPVYIGFAFLVLLGGVLFLVDWSEVKIIKRILAVLEFYGGDILGVIFSGRLSFFVDGWLAYINLYTPFQWVFGAGAAGAREAVGVYSGIVQGVESDFLDLGLVYGLLGFCIAVGLWLFVLAKSVTVLMRPASALTHVLAFNTFLLTGLSVIAGHVLTSGLGGPILGLAIGLLYRHRVLAPGEATSVRVLPAAAVS